MNKSRSERLQVLLSTARSNPEFASQLVLELPEAVRAEMLSELARPAPRKPVGEARPGIKKCNSDAAGRSAQLNLFARSVARVG